mmetsp:Transcript_65284/g.131301  ORF Transcript_65284/g.131301 Transcript_65284/m.131301 type:complete len:391 (-) Transcript_65284:125-1297(-)
MLAGAYVISVTSAKWCLLFSLSLYAVYVASYLVAVVWPATAWPAVLFGAAVGGVGAGLLWTAQGAYFKINAKKYAIAMGIPEEEATGLFSSTFAAFYLGLELAMKVAGSLVARYGSAAGKYSLYGVYSVVAVGCTFLMLGVREMHPEGGAEETSSSAKKPYWWLDKITAALALLFTNPKCALMVPTNCAFGFAAAFINSYIQGSVVAPLHDRDDDAWEGDDEVHAEYHDSQVLLYSSLAVGVATLLALPGFGFHWLRQKAGTPAVMFIGAGCFVFVSLMALTVEGASLRHALWLLYVVFGAGRSVWEATVKAIFGDFFTEKDSQAAFANIVIQSGTASTLAFFIFPNLAGETKAFLLLFTSIVGFVCYFVAHGIHTREKATAATYNSLGA